MLPGDAAPFEAVKQTQMIGLSPGMTQLKKEIEIVAASDLNVLISGETEPVRSWWRKRFMKPRHGR